VGDNVRFSGRMVMNYKKWLDSEYIPKLKPIAF
jgi:hypothetical protein